MIARFLAKVVRESGVTLERIEAEEYRAARELHVVATGNIDEADMTRIIDACDKHAPAGLLVKVLFIAGEATP